MSDQTAKIRIDKWLWHARFFKTRTLAATICKGGKIRVNGLHIAKASVTVQAGDVLTFPKADRILVIKILAPGERRGPATEAQTLYEDLTPPEEKKEAMPFVAAGAREKGSGRPTKAERRAIEKLHGDFD